jgi:hypothetical protein
MWLIKNYKTNKYYKTKYDITNDKLCQLHSLPFIKSGILTENECVSERKCLDRFPQIEVVMHFDGRRNTWMRDC